MDGRWHTVENVQPDIARAMGQMPAPPAQRGEFDTAGQDAEIELEFGCEVAALRGPQQAGSLTPQLPAPDFHGFSEMPRMVENDECNKWASQSSLNDDISKLNPSAKEFIPGPAALDSKTRINFKNVGHHGCNKHASHPSANNDISKLNPSAKEFIPGPAALDSRTSIHLKNHPIVNSQTKYDEYQTEWDELAALLKSKTCSTLQRNDSFCIPQGKYAAIVNLIELQSSPPLAAPSGPIELCSLDYNNSQRAAAIENPADYSNESSDIERRPALGRKLATSEATISKPEIEASILKVSNWLNSKPVPVAAPYLAPVGYMAVQADSGPGKATSRGATPGAGWEPSLDCTRTKLWAPGAGDQWALTHYRGWHDSTICDRS